MSFDPSLPEDGINVSRSHPLREAALLVGGVVAVVVAIGVAAALLVDLVVPRLPVGLERRLFAFSAIAVPSEEAGERADLRARAVQALLDRLTRHWSENPYGVRAAVWEAGEPNALAFPGGWIVVTTGLLEQAGSENELAFVLGHELGHFHRRDHLRGLGRGLALGLVIAGLGGSGAGSAVQLADLAARLAQRGFDREQESDADRFGLQLVAAEYGHVAGADDFFARLAGARGAGGQGFAHYLSTHPLHADRVATLRRVAAREGWPTRGALRPIPPARRPGIPLRLDSGG
jgi:Zn-dependent protease with chaperone function